MASCDWQKMKGGTEAKAIMRHSTPDTRLKDNHSNKDIDKGRTADNISLGAMGSYEEACRAYDARLAELDAQPGANRRKDRVTMVGLCIPAPPGLDDQTAARWLTDAYGIVCEEMGGQNMIGGSIQVDEQHEYVDARTGRTVMSRQHLHAYGIPEKDGKLNAKAVTARWRMKNMNNRIEAMSQEKYGLPWMTGEGRKSDKSMDELKADSAKAAQEQAEQEASKIVEQARQEADRIAQEAAQTAQEASERLEVAKAKEEAVKASEEATEARLGLKETRLNLREAELNEKAAGLEEREKGLKEQEEALKERDRKQRKTAMNQLSTTISQNSRAKRLKEKAEQIKADKEAAEAAKKAAEDAEQKLAETTESKKAEIEPLLQRIKDARDGLKHEINEDWNRRQQKLEEAENVTGEADKWVAGLEQIYTDKPKGQSL